MTTPSSWLTVFNRNPQHVPTVSQQDVWLDRIFQTRGGATELVEGGPEPKRVVILEFADKEAIKRWYNSPEYQKILPGRLDNATGRAFIGRGRKLAVKI
jgi:Domain of unknown function (DUF1330)